VSHAQEHTAEVGVDDAVPFRLGDVSGGRARLFDPGVVEGDVEPPECVDRLL
jgi:hypothetical protein